jgi:hypothetical protein
MSAVSTLRTQRTSVAEAVAAAPDSEAVAHSNPIQSPSTCCAAAVAVTALEEQNRQLSIQMQRMQERTNRLEQQVQGMAARPSTCASVVAAASSPVHVAALCSVRQQSFSSLHTQLAIGQQLHKDALHCVLAYLSLTELPSAMRSCRTWYAAVRSLPLQEASFGVRSTRQLHRLLISSSTPLARHVVACEVRDTYTVDELAQFLTRLPRLQSLSHSVCRSTELHPQLYSSHLRELNVNLPSDQRRLLYDDFFAQLANLSSARGLRCLTLTVPCNYPLILESLECMKELESLTLLNSNALPSEQLVNIRRLPSLRTLSLDGWSEWQVEALLEDHPDFPPLQLHTFEGHEAGYITLERAELLARMTTLQRVEPWRITPEALRLLAHGLPNLHTLVVHMNVSTPESGWAIVRDSLAVCHRLTFLTLVWPSVNELTALLLALPPSVLKLDIRLCPRFLQSEAFFQCIAAGGLRRLEHLHFWMDLSLVNIEYNWNMYTDAARWHARQRACAPWINAVLHEE